MNYAEKVFGFLKKYPDFFTAAGLILFCYFIFIFNNGSYALMDTDETRYVSMARDMFNTKDFLTLYLNGEYFFEKPPLYFWLECLSFAVFGQINEFTARFPAALLSSLCVLLMYFTGKRIVSRRFGVISALIAASSLEFLILAKFAILDIILASFVCFSVMCGFLTQFTHPLPCPPQEGREREGVRQDKYFWLLFYIFSGFAVLAKGVPGFIIPFGVMFFVLLFNKSLKQAFKPQNCIPGILAFLLIVLPWHIIMLKMHNPVFFDEYIMKHHIDRFFSSSDVQRKEPFYFYFLTLVWGLFPYIFSVIAAGTAKIKEFLRDKRLFHLTDLSNPQKFLRFNIIGFAFTLLFFSVSSTKLITYILPVYFFTSFIIAYIWEDYIYLSKYKKAINISVYILGGFFIIAATAGCFMQLYVPENIYEHIKIIQWFGVFTALFFGISSICFAKKENYKGVFVSYVLLMLILSAFGTKLIYNLDYSFGQNDLVKFAKYCKNQNLEPAVINGGRKYSVMYYYGGRVHYISMDKGIDIPPAAEEILLKDNVQTIVRKRDIKELAFRFDFEETLEGVKYKLVKIKSVKP